MVFNLLVWLGEVVCDVFFFIVRLGNEDKILGGVFFFFVFLERERGYDKTMEDEEEGEGRVWSRLERRKGREEGTLL